MSTVPKALPEKSVSVMGPFQSSRIRSARRRARLLSQQAATSGHSSAGPDSGVGSSGANSKLVQCVHSSSEEEDSADSFAEQFLKKFPNIPNPLTDPCGHSAQVFGHSINTLVKFLEPMKNAIVVGMDGESKLRARTSLLYRKETYDYWFPASTVQEILSNITPQMPAELIKALLATGLDPNMFLLCHPKIQAIVKPCFAGTSTFASLVKEEVWYAAFNRMRRGVDDFFDSLDGESAINCVRRCTHWGLEMEMDYFLQKTSGVPTQGPRPTVPPTVAGMKYPSLIQYVEVSDSTSTGDTDIKSGGTEVQTTGSTSLLNVSNSLVDLDTAFLTVNSDADDQ